MSTKKRVHLFLVFTVFMFAQSALTVLAGETLRLPKIFSDKMVLQRNQDVPVWGWAKSGETVTVTFAGQTLTTTAGQNGKWIVKLKPLTASAEPAEMQIKTGSATKRIKNILVGEVWLCSGQSNMTFGVGGFGRGGVLNIDEEVKNANNPAIRQCFIPHLQKGLPQDDVPAKWQICSPAKVRRFTAVGYFFARKLYKELNVPIGLIHSSWGGTRIEPWTSPEGFRQVKELPRLQKRINLADPKTVVGKAAYEKTLAALEQWLPQAKKALAEGSPFPEQPQIPSTGATRQDPLRIYNAMIHPLIPYAIRGTIWYQGEANGGEGVSYYYKMRALIQGWRTLWNQGDFPFFFVQLANFRGDQNQPQGGDGWAKVREAQRHSLTIPNTGMAVTIDIGEARNIHPKNKQDVGMRLALWALAKTYGQKDLVYSGPLYKSYTIKGNQVRIEFDQVGSGLMVGKKRGLAPTQEVKDGVLKRFAIAGADNKWYWADARIDGNAVVVSSKNVPAPVSVHYAFSMNPVGCNLYNKEGLPASPFRFGKN